LILEKSEIEEKAFTLLIFESRLLYQALGMAYSCETLNQLMLLSETLSHREKENITFSEDLIEIGKSVMKQFRKEVEMEFSMGDSRLTIRKNMDKVYKAASKLKIRNQEVPLLVISMLTRNL
jgi:hypothetical protein